MPKSKLSVLQDIVQLMTQSVNFRTQVPRVLQLLCQHLDAGRAVFLEIAPTASRADRWTFQRIIEVPSIGQAIERQVPRQLLGKSLEQATVMEWLNQLTLHFGATTVAEGLALPAILSSPETVQKLKSGKLSHAIIRALDIDFASFVLLPLKQEDKIGGLLFFLSSQSRMWDSGGVSLAQSSAQLLAHSLARQHQEYQRLLHDQFLISKRLRLKEVGDGQAEEPVLREVDKMYALITSTIPDFIFLVDIEQGKILFTNTDLFLGYNIVEADNPLDIFTNKIHPDDHAEAIGNFLYKLRDAKDGEVIDSEYRMQHANGQWVWVNERAKVFDRFPNGIVKQYISIIQDITTQKESNLKVEKSEARYRNFVTYSNEGIYYINCSDPIPTYLPLEEQAERFSENAYLQECNDTLVSMFGYSVLETLVGQKVKHLENVGALMNEADFYALLVGENYKITHYETERVAQDGSTAYFIHQAIGIIESNHLVGIWGVQRDITAKRAAEKALLDSELRLTSIAQDARLGVWEWQEEAGHIHISPVGLELLGVGGRVSPVTLNQFIDWIHEDDRSVLAQTMNNHVVHHTDNFQVDIRMVAKGSNYHWLQLHGRLVARSTNGQPMRYSGTMIDIHELKIAELLLQEGDALLSAVLDAIPDTKLRVDVYGRILSIYGNEPTNDDIPFSMERILGKNVKDVFLVFVAKGLIFNARKAIDTGVLQTFEFLDARETQTRYYEARFNRINEREAIIILRDISAIKFIEKELNEQVHKYDLKNRQLEKYIESNLQLENFAYIASHDLREPVRTMRTFGQFLERRIGKDLDEDAKTYLQFIISGADRMNMLIEDLLTYSKVNTEPLTREAIDTEALVMTIIGNLNARIEEVKARIIIQNIPAIIYGSPSRMQQVFQNLVANGIKFYKEGVPPKVVITSTETPSHWKFSVADNGIGIEPEFFEQIFIIFKKLHSNEAYTGTGIGLALVKRIVAQHGGEVWLTSKPGVGTTFHFTILK